MEHPDDSHSNFCGNPLQHKVRTVQPVCKIVKFIIVAFACPQFSLVVPAFP